ncbi:MAG: FliO/MopB family protein [Fimbriimonadaceae bacterium]
MNRLLLTIGIALLSALTVAQEAAETAADSLGTKPNLINESTGGTSLLNGWDILQMLAALAVVVGLLAWLLPKFAKKMGGKFSASADSSMRVEETANVGASSLFVVKVRGRCLLLGSTQQSITCLADLTESDEKENREPAFFEVLDNETKKSAAAPRRRKSAEELISEEEAPTQAVVHGNVNESQDPELQKQLETLRRVQQRVQGNPASEHDAKASADRLKKLLS